MDRGRCRCSFTALGVGALADAAIAMTPTMNAEAIWQASIVTSDRVIMMLQEPVYIRAPDIPLYAKATNLAPPHPGAARLRCPRASSAIDP